MRLARAIHAILFCVATVVTFHATAAALPTPRPGATVSVYATFPTRPARISFDAAGDLYVGNFNDPGPPNGPAPFWRVDAGDQSVVSCGTVDDPDAVFVDRDGIVGPPGTLLVGGWRNPDSVGEITSVAPGCGSGSLMSSGGCVGNVNTFAADEAGRLYLTNATELTVCVYENGAWSEFLPALPSASRLSIDGPDLYISYDDSVRRYDLNGVEQDTMVTVGELLTIGPEGDLYVGRGTELVAVDPVTRAELTILSSIVHGVSDAEFDSAGNLYVVQNTEYRILRVENPRATAVGDPTLEGAFLAVHPNPASGLTQVSFRGARSNVPVEVFDARGRRLRTLHTDREAVTFDTSDWPSGVYFVRAGVEGGGLVRKLLVLR